MNSCKNCNCQDRCYVSTQLDLLFKAD